MWASPQIENLAEAELAAQEIVPRVLENGVIYQTTFFRPWGRRYAR
jgi:hypothetical protein